MANQLERDLDVQRAALAAAERRIAELQAELARYKANAHVSICLWCLERVARTAEAIQAHLPKCPTHPMRALEREVQRLRSLLGIVDGE